MSKYQIEWRTDEDEPEDCKDEKSNVARAIQTWSWFQQRPTSVAEAAAAFNIEPKHVIEAIDEEDSPYVFLAGPRDDYSKLMIEHDGE